MLILTSSVLMIHLASACVLILFARTGRWVTVIDGACIGETVTGRLELVDEGSRLLIRLGGPGTAICIYNSEYIYNSAYI